MSTEKYPWEGNRDQQMQIRLTLAEREEVQEICRQRGIKSVGEYLRQLHHKSLGRMKEGVQND